jgi:hypothetical protein
LLSIAEVFGDVVNGKAKVVSDGRGRGKEDSVCIGKGIIESEEGLKGT